MIENNSENFNEAERQLLLLRTARELISEPKILLALDADEILAANATETQSWQTIINAKPGTVLFFEKPDLFITTHQCIRTGIMTPLGYVDDGAEHKPLPIHSIRIPMPEYALRLHVHDVKVLHYSLTRIDAHAAKTRFYAVLENVLKVGNAVGRRYHYYSKQDYKSLGKVESAPQEWFTNWEKMGIDMHTIVHQKYYPYDFEVLRYFHKYKPRRFWIEDIWKHDWETCRQYAKSLGIKNIPDYQIQNRAKIGDFLLDLLSKLYGKTSLIIKYFFKDA
ncbi:MAG: glycosyltransferase family 2 protein [Hassallia sp.]